MAKRTLAERLANPRDKLATYRHGLIGEFPMRGVGERLRRDPSIMRQAERLTTVRQPQGQFLDLPAGEARCRLLLAERRHIARSEQEITGARHQDRSEHRR